MKVRFRVQRQRPQGQRQQRLLSFQKANVLELPFEDESFEFVFSNGVVHHTENMELAIREVIRVAKPKTKIWLYMYADGGLYWYVRKKAPRIMKRIPQNYTISVLDLIGMPRDRFIFTDNWYVPIERHTTDKKARQILADCGASKINRLEYGRSNDLNYFAIHGGEVGKILYGDGELRYIIEK